MAPTLAENSRKSKAEKIDNKFTSIYSYYFGVDLLGWIIEVKYDVFVIDGAAYKIYWATLLLIISQEALANKNSSVSIDL